MQLPASFQTYILMCLTTSVRTMQEMKVYEQYIMGMLTNFSAGLPLDRIHNMLKMFVSEPPYDKSAAQLEAFLGRLVNEEKLAFASDLYTKRA